ncbi:hypothetical protein ACUXVY_18900 [Chromobacterium haemolyticum]|uniref:hypothetical protein n=1 Tax=Chromobacterium haemolyticum TaxID=394935 RepID=UPI004055B480
MDIKDIRLVNLKALVAEFETIAQVARQSDTNEAYLSHILNGVLLPSGRPRGVGHALARKLEQGCGKPTGWMDHPHPNGDGAIQRIEASSLEELAGILGELETGALHKLITDALAQHAKKAS